MPRIPQPDYGVPEMESPKLYAVTYTYEVDGCWFADTWNISGEKSIADALQRVDDFCSGSLEAGNWTAYEITNINIIRRGV